MRGGEGGGGSATAVISVPYTPIGSPLQVVVVFFSVWKAFRIENCFLMRGDLHCLGRSIFFLRRRSRESFRRRTFFLFLRSLVVLTYLVHFRRIV